MLFRIVKAFGSLRLTVVLLTLAMVLVFIGTLAQKHIGLYEAQLRYFRSFIIWWQPQGAAWRLPAFPGGYLLGGLILLNLLVSYAESLRQIRGRVGLLLAHGGLILLVIGQFATDALQVESHMRLIEGEPKNYSESSMSTELALVKAAASGQDQVISVPESVLARNHDLKLEGVPFTIRVAKYFPNSRLANRPRTNATPAAATQGVGQFVTLSAVPKAVKLDERNLPSAVLEIVGPQGSLGTWLVSIMLDQRQEVTVNGETWTLSLRSTRYYKPFSLTLIKFRHDKYTGTEIPKNFSSEVRLQNPATGEDRKKLIYMNNPLRYAGETFYQSSFDPNDPRVSILQVVRNPGWLTPYLSCALVGLGLFIQFMSHLITFVRERRSA